jgi:ADP-ribose pyrophosphatase
MKFETIHSQKIYQGRAFNVRRDEVRLPDGNSTQLDIVEHSGAITILPLDADGNIWFVRQYRHAAGDTLLELPAGTLEPGEPPENAARREIREEIGMAADTLTLLGEFFLAPGYSTEYMYVYLATGLYPSPLKQDADEFLSIEKIPASHVPQLVAEGSLRDAKSLVSLYLGRDRLPA